MTLMKSLLLAVVLTLIGTPLALLGQYTVVTGQIIDPNNIAYASCQVNVSLSNPGGQTPVFGGAPMTLQQMAYAATCDNTGTFSVTLPSNTAITNTVTQWNFNVVAQDGVTAFSLLQSITGSAQNLSSQLSSISVIQPCAIVKSTTSLTKLKLAGNCGIGGGQGTFPGPGWSYVDPVITAGASAQLNMGAAPTATGFQLPFASFGNVPTLPAGIAVDTATNQVNFNDGINNHFVANVDYLSISPITNGIYVGIVSTGGPPILSTVSLLGSSNDIVITNPDGTAGNPTIASFATGVAAGSYTCPTLGINVFGKITSAANGTCSGGGTGNTTSTALVNGNLPVANGANSIIDSGIGAFSGNLQFNGSVSGNITLAPNSTATTLSIIGTGSVTLLTVNGTAGNVVMGPAINTGIDFVGNALNYSSGGTNVISLATNAAKCNGTCNWEGSSFGQQQTFQSGIDTTTAGTIGGTAFFRSAAITGGGTPVSGTGNAIFGTGNNAATGGTGQSIGIAYFTAGGFTGASGAATSWTPGYTVLGQYYWADTTATAGTLGCVTTAGTNNQMPKIGTCKTTTNVAWKGVIQQPTGFPIGQSVFLVKSGHAAMISATAQADPAGSFVCIDPANAGDIVVQATACTTGQTVGTIDTTGSGGTTHIVDVIARPQEASGGAGGSPAWNTITNPSGNLALTMNANTSTFTFNATTGSSDLWALTDTLNNTGTGILQHIFTASGSTEIPWQADNNGNGVRVTAAGLLTKVGTGAIDATVLSGTASVNTTGTAANLSGTPALPNGTTATTQSSFSGDNKLATNKYVDLQTQPLYTNPTTALTLSTSTGILTGVTGTGCTSGVCTMTTPSVDGTYRFVAEVIETTAGVGCNAGAFQVQLGWTAADTNTVYVPQGVGFTTVNGASSLIISLTPSTTVVGSGTDWISNPREFRAKASNAIKYQVNQTVAEAGCTTTPVETIRVALYGPLGY